MRKIVLVTGLMLAMAGPASWAGGIQLCRTGDGCIGGAVFISPSLGNTEGNMLFDDVMIGLDSPLGGGNGTGTLRAHNSFDISIFTGFASELTIDVVIPISTVFSTGGAGVLPEQVSVSQNGPGVFRMFYDDLGSVMFATGGVAANPITGAGYTDGVQIDIDAVFLTPFVTSTTDATLFNPLSTTNGLPTITTTGGTTMGIDFTVGGLDANWIVNNPTGALVDLSTANSVTTPHDGILGPPFLPPTGASTAFTGQTVIPFHGTDGQNDYNCGAIEVCDFQAQMNTTVLFTGTRIPEPGTVALMGMGLALVGGMRRRNRKV